MATGALVLKISADITDFTKQLNRLTRDVREAADQVSEMGKKLSIGVTLPVTLAGAALMKMAAENEEAAARMQRSFGPAVTEVQARLDRLAKTMPVAGTELQNMATRINDVAQELGFAKPAAAQLSTSILTMANDLSAFAAVPAADAAKALTSALQGEAGGLKALGITISEAVVKQKALEMGILKTGETITPTGKALATYAALLERSGQFAGEAARRQNDIGRQLQLIKRDLAEVADRLATRLIPFFRNLTGMLRVVVGWIEKVPMGFWVTVSAAAAMAAAIGPAAIAVAQLTKAFVLMQAAIQIINGAAGITGLLGKMRALATNPAVLALIAVAVAAGAAYVAYRKFRGEVEQSSEDADEAADGLAQLQDLLNGINRTSAPAGDAVQQLTQRSQRLHQAISQQMEAGGGAVTASLALRDLQREALELYEQQNDKLSDQAILLQGLVLQAARLQAVQDLAGAMTTNRAGNATFAPNPRFVAEALQSAMEERGQAAERVAGSTIMAANDLQTREVALEMARVFPVARLAAVELAEGFIKAREDIAMAAQTLKQSWGQSNFIAGIKSATQQLVAPLLAGFTPAALAAGFLGKVLDGMRPVVESLMQPLSAIAQVVGALVTPIFKALWPVIKAVAEVAAFLGEIIARVVAGIATGVGRLLVGIGKMLNLLPGSIGNPIIRAGRGMLGFADSMYEAASTLRQTRREIRNMQWVETAEAVDTLGAAARETAEALLNIPSGFRIALERYRAQAPYLPGADGAAPTLVPPGPTGGGSRGGGGEGAAPTGGPLQSLVVPVMLDGRMVARVVLDNLQRAAQQQAGSSTDWAMVQSL